MIRFFFFSSRRRHTRCLSDWSSDVCSSDLIYHWQTNTATGGFVAPGTDFDSFMGTVKKIGAQPIIIANYGTGTPQEAAARSEERRVGKECRSRWSPEHENKRQESNQKSGQH